MCLAAFETFNMPSRKKINLEKVKASLEHHLPEVCDGNHA
jgi:hypothetical protein